MALGGMSQLVRFTKAVWRCPSYCIITDHWEREYTYTGHWVVSLTVPRHNMLNLELHVYSRLNAILWYMLYSMHCKMMQEYLPWGIIFHLRLLRFSAGDQPTEWNKSIVAVLRKCSMLIFVKSDLKIPSPASHVDAWNFTMKILNHL